MKPRTIIFIFGIGLLNASCEVGKGRYIARVSDATAQVIESYVKENKIDLKAKVVTIDIASSEYRTDIYISNLGSRLYREKGYAPSFYSIVEDSIVMFIYSGTERIITTDVDQVIREIDEILGKKHVTLSQEIGIFYHAPMWRYTLCGDKSTLIKRSSPWERYFIPCGYTLRQDSTVTDSLFVEKWRSAPAVPQ